MKRILFVLVLILSASCEEPRQGKVTWEIGNPREVGGNSVTVQGDPQIVDEEQKEFLEFNGKDDGLLVHANPIQGMNEFTIAVDFKPFPGYPENREQRFLHIQDPNNEDRRILLELRLNEHGEWYGDWFMKSENESITLIDSTFTFPVNEWATMSMVYRDGTLKGYVNGKENVSGQFKYLPLGKNAKTSIGTRMDQRSWFKGAIKEIRFTSEAKKK